MADTTTLDRDLIEEKRVRMTLVRYPDDVKAGAIELIKWDIANRGGAVVKSETISRHRVDYAVPEDAAMKQGYPADLLAFLAPYRKAQF